jgi:Transposase IS4
MWAVQSLSGDTITENGDDIRMMTRSPYEYYKAIFPQDQLARIVRLTSRGLEDRDTMATSAGEVLKFIGVLSLATRFEFGNRHDLWSTTGANRLMNGPNFRAMTGMSRNRFDESWSCMMFSDQADQRENESSVQQRWKLVTDFVDSINDHRQVHFTPSEVICLNESISWWYGQEDQWTMGFHTAYPSIESQKVAARYKTRPAGEVVSLCAYTSSRQRTIN